MDGCDSGSVIGVAPRVLPPGESDSPFITLPGIHVVAGVCVFRHYAYQQFLMLRATIIRVPVVHTHGDDRAKDAVYSLSPRYFPMAIA